MNNKYNFSSEELKKIIDSYVEKVNIAFFEDLQVILSAMAEAGIFIEDTKEAEILKKAYIAGAYGMIIRETRNKENEVIKNAIDILKN